MKKLLIIVMLVPSMVLHSQQDTSRLNPKQVYEDVKAGFTKLVSTLEGPAKHTYEVYVYQNKIEGTVDFITTFFMLLLALWFIYLSFKMGKWMDGEPQNAWAILQIVSVILLIIVVGFFVFNMSGNISQIYNPEYHAIQKIIETIK